MIHLEIVCVLGGNVTSATPVALNMDHSPSKTTRDVAPSGDRPPELSKVPERQTQSVAELISKLPS